MARQTLEFMDQDHKVIVEVYDPGNTYVRIITHTEYISLRLSTLRKIVHHINRSHWKDD